MDAGLKKIAAGLNRFWTGLSAKVRVLLVIVVVGAIVGAVAANMLLTQTQYELIYSGLSDAESGQIVADLQTRGIKYKLDGNSIYVDKSVADQARMELAVDGYPQTTLNYSVYESGNNWAMTDKDKQQLALYQIQDRLQSTIQTIPGVKNAIVTITQGNDDTYVLESDKVSPTASVKLTLTPGTTLTQKQVTGIVNIVSHSVSGLSADNVTVADSDGNTLNNTGDDLSGATSDQLALRVQVESEIRQKVLSVLGPVYGAANVQVSPAAILDFTTTTTNTTTYSGPDNGQGFPSSVSSSITVSGGTGTASGGTVGVNGAQPAYPTSGSQTSSLSGTVTQQNTNTTYLYNQVQQQVQDKGGSIKNLTIGIMLNSANQAIAGLDPTQVQQFVAYAVGTAPQNVNVQLMRFASSSAVSSGGKGSASGTSGLGSPTTLLTIAGIGAAAVVLILLLLFFLLRGRKRKKALQEEAEAQAEQAQAAQPVKPGPPMSAELAQKLDEMPDNPVKKQIEDFTDSKPELVAQLLRNWLKDN
ncbi:flagellar basal-body MS-ring/collar protein FliF [Ethanoligenens harbinense]|uniref:Flagellar M-ring protein n=1 Tax=Ethanoligenens harbinense (strain DSM 18485 / JCM 12961 / CGMCC 1.5033 / YUAN-3) TaxID=663278 RepID=E6U6K2_ETHHY|nr:flagellar basal-body MS-ring/collar protein FliF [Ethanoligenens harbinense]ADU28072.1 flagellar M-ring protein FliF [Ethanoligenens harbinense YUAN-3]AVQ97086.1 flagellar M-ring protein FliF [Ethanoligenens harbinense YUAN-3]AYF39748.1 flagellar M-ring protein FliF [Ethanoligenens harbinense]AYF42581.1 flagellar M-ring protein FliF [Ethanoligenens harbinense]QCN93329.1 flagellar M-ring protein FliF [Ethanoligenens harbinense]